MPPDILYKLEVESLDVGAGIRAAGLELLDPETREPVQGSEAAKIWAAILPALAAGEPWTLDFFAHLNRVRDYCGQHGIEFREPNPHVLVIPALPPDKLSALFERFADATFGVRAGKTLEQVDTALEDGLAGHGVDAYEPEYRKYLFCAICDFENGFLTVLSEGLWATEVIRRIRTVMEPLHVEVTRPA